MSRTRTFEGESQDGVIQEALDQALGRLGGEIGADGVGDGLAQWVLTDVTGQYGGIAGLSEVKVTISATRSPEWS